MKLEYELAENYLFSVAFARPKEEQDDLYKKYFNYVTTLEKADATTWNLVNSIREEIELRK